MQKKITKLSVFDFDGTLISSPLPETGKVLYEQKIGQKWPHKGWWGKKESLDTNIFDIEAIDEVIVDYKVEILKEDTLVIMLTGRLTVLAKDVESILEIKGLKFDEHHYNTGGETCYVKLRTLDKTLERFPDIKEISIWDDRSEHIPRFQAWGDKQILDGLINKFNITHVLNGQHG